MQIDLGGERHTVPAGVVLGLIGDSDSGVREMLRGAGGRRIGPGDELDWSAAPVIGVDYALDLADAATRLLVEEEFERLRRDGSRVLLASHDRELLRRSADELWWVDAGRVKTKGDPAEVLHVYAAHTAQRIREAGAGSSSPMRPSMRRGDGRAELVSLETVGTSGEPTRTWNSGEAVGIRLRVRFAAGVTEPVAGIMIRTRIGMEVYGTNTELEHVKFGPCAAGEEREILFRFACNLCPGYYTITAASHDPDGVWHDWVEDAVAVTVADTRYTAGVANLRAAVEAKHC